REVNSIKLLDDTEGRPIYVRVGKNGAYLERMVPDADGEAGELKPQRANLKDELTPDELTLDLAEKLFATPQEGRSLGVDPETGADSARPRRRRVNSAKNARPVSGSSSRTDGSGRMSPTVRPTPACARATTCCRSPTSAPPSCSPTGGRAVRSSGRRRRLPR